MAIKDRYPGNIAPDAPADAWYAITPDDSNDLPEVVRAIYVGVGGNISLVDRTGTSAVFKGAQAGSVLALRAARVNASGTTATDLVGLT